MIETDAIIIGAGPVGLFAIFECGLMKIRCHVIDNLPEVGGQCSALYPEKPIYDIPGYPAIAAGELVKNLHKQAAPFKPVYHLGQSVDSLEKVKNSDNWQIKTSNNTIIMSKIIIIAAGAGGFGPKRPPMENLKKYEKDYVHYFIRNKEIYRDKTLVIAGGGDSAVDWANNLHEIAKKIYVVHRRDKFRAAPDSIEKMKSLANNSDKISMVTPYQLKKVNGNEEKLESITVYNFDNEEKILKADFLLPFFGLSINLGPIANWGLNFNKNQISVDQATSMTSEKNIFAIGDIATYQNKLKLILSGFAEAAQAAHKAREIIYPNKQFHFEYSTTSGIKGL